MTITLKNVPRSLHRTLKRQAKEEKRSLNQDLIKSLAENAEARDRRQRAFVDLVSFRDKLKSRKIDPALDPVRIIRQLRDSR